MAVTSPYKIDVSRGSLDSTISKNWATRSPDEKFTSMQELGSFLKTRKENSRVSKRSLKDLRFKADKQTGTVVVDMPASEKGSYPLEPTHWAFSQLCYALGCPANFLRKLPADLVIKNMQEMQKQNGDLDVKILGQLKEQGNHLLRAITGPDYGRIFDHQLFKVVDSIVQDDPRWKIPGMIDWGSMRHNPHVDVTKDTTTLYAGDQDMVMFLCQDADPIVAGKLPNGDDDLYFPGFYGWNSEVGKETCGASIFFLRGVCQNRNLWGVQDKTVIKVKHTKYAPQRFHDELVPMLKQLTSKVTKKFIETVQASKEKKIGGNVEERIEFLRKIGLTKKQALATLARVDLEEGHPAETAFDLVQGITACARSISHQNDRLTLEGIAEKVMLTAA